MQRPHTLEAYLLINDLYGSAASSREESPERTIKTSPSSSSSKDKISTSTAASVTSSHTQRSSAEKTESGREEKHSYDSSSRSSHTEGSSRGLFSSSSQKNQWQLSLSYDEFIAMDTELLQLQWWGVGTLEDEEGRTSLLSSSTSSSSGGSKGGVESRTLGNEDSLSWGGEKQLYQLRLIKNTQGSSSRSSSSSSQTVKKGAGRGGEERENDEKSKQFFLILQRVMMEAAEGVKVDETAVQTVQAMEASFGYEDTLFDKSIRKNEEENELEWGDAQSEEVTDDENEAAVPLVQRDPTREVWSKCPDTMLYKNMVVGKNRTFVFRQAAQAPHQQTKNTIQVVGFDEYGKTKIVTTVQDNKFDFNSKHVSPAAALLQDGGNKMVLVDENRENAFMMDLEREKIVQKWDADHMTIGGVMPTRKDDLNERTFVAFNPQSIFCMDTRLASNARTHSLSYATKVNFTCGGTDQGGHIATGNAIGDVRLYDGGVNAEGKYKRAKTHLKGLGDPLLHICSLSDGSWVLGTCQKYLVLFPVKLSTNGKTGFVTALGKQKPHPIVLRLRLEDIAHYNLQELNFTKAEFDANETTIVTSTNNLVIIWDFIAVKRGDLFAYSIRKIHDYIKDVAFAKTSVGDSDRVIMATPASVSTKALKKLVR
ncbi:cytoplasmic protein [Cystoisospora suis]|uniref:Cytoplasmic protein n=1 Tax=Cystoisospora suis TaxID=483139 RepID=A0A2C6LD67_9APIC|nr:cytoplasmic protein [Cystoisospora suis]